MSGNIILSRNMGSSSYSNGDEDDVEVAETSLWDLLRAGGGGSSWDGLRKRNTVTQNRTSDHDIEYKMPRKVTQKSQAEQHWKAFPGGYCDGSYSDLDGTYQSRDYMSDGEDEDEDSREVDYGNDGRDGGDGGDGCAFDLGLDSDDDDLDDDLDSLTEKFAAQRLKYSETERLGEMMRERAYNRSIMQATAQTAALAAVSVDSMDLDADQMVTLESPIPPNDSRVLSCSIWRKSAKRQLDELDCRSVRPLKLSATKIAKIGRRIIVPCRPTPKAGVNIDNNPFALLTYYGDEQPVLRLENFTSLQVPSTISGMGRKRGAIAIEPAHEQGSGSPCRRAMDRTPTAPQDFIQIDPLLLLPYKPTVQIKKHAQRKVLQPIQAATRSPEFDLKDHRLAGVKIAQLKAEVELHKASFANDADTEMDL